MNIALANELTVMAEEDHLVRQRLIEEGELRSHEYHPVMKEVHERNAASLKEIINQHGWPGISLVGKRGAQSAWLIAQHAVSDYEFMLSAGILLEECVLKNDAESWQLAFLQDRIRVMSGKLQRYGTQFFYDEDGWPAVCPIENPETVNERRVGLGLNTLEERQKQLREEEKKERRSKKNTRRPFLHSFNRV